MTLTLFWAFYGLTGIGIGVFLWDYFKSILPDLEQYERDHKIGTIIMVAILWPMIFIIRQ